MDGESERRVITALFIDVVGSTDLMMRVGPEVMRRRLADAFEQMSARIEEQGGTVENYAGDAVFAIFGAPTAHVDDPVRALRAARACADWSADSLAGERLSVRAGVETGEALVDLAAVERHERMAIGPCVNIAARLQQQADPGQVVVGPAAHNATINVAEFEDLGDLSLKGLGNVSAWRFVNFSTEVGAAEVPFVGREEELMVLAQAADRAADGTPVLALILGDPGLGKSRLAHEAIQTRLLTESVRVIEARCRPAGEEGANTPLRQLLGADIPDLTAESAGRRLADLLGADDGPRLAVAILHSTGIESSAEMAAMGRYEQRETIAEAWRRYLFALAADKPLIVFVEDLHWADPVLIRVLEHVTSEPGAYILVVATARPEFLASANLGAADNRIEIALGPLDDRATTLLAQAARGAVAGLDRAAGNPLFVIELARAGAAAPAIDLPLTIQAAISARLDELSTDERQLLQSASVAGETFDVREAALLSDRDTTDVAGLLGRMAHRGFVVPVEQGYRFHHALVRDVAYGRLPVSQRLALHLRYANEGVAPTDHVARAFHLWEAARPPDADWVWDDPQRLQKMREAAFASQLAAGEVLEARNQYEQAEEVYRRAVELAADPQARGRAQVELGRAMARQGKGDEQWATRLAAIDSYAEAGVPPPARLYADMLEVATMNWGWFLNLPPDSVVAEMLDVGQRLARESGDDVSLARLLMERAAFSGDSAGTQEVMQFLDGANAVEFADAGHRMAEVLMWQGQLANSIALYKRVFDDLLPAGGVINEPEAMVWFGLAGFSEGDLAIAHRMAEHAYVDLGKGRSVHTQSHVYGLRSLLAFGSGDWDALARSTNELRELCDTHPDIPMCLVSAFAIGYGAAGELVTGGPFVDDLEAAARRQVEDSELVQAASIVLPKAMLGDADALERAWPAYAPELRLWDRAAAWDVAHLMPAMAACALERWDALDGSLARLDFCAAGGSRLAAAAAIAIREERAAAVDGGPEPEHAELIALGYKGVSELLRYRARSPHRAAA